MRPQFRLYRFETFSLGCQRNLARCLSRTQNHKSGTTEKFAVIGDMLFV